MEQSNSILIVDDGFQSRIVGAEILRSEGYHVVEAASGEEALQFSREFVPDLILMDVIMPGMDGFETVAEIKKSTAFGDVPVIFMTGLGDRESRVKGFAFGAVDYLTKPAYREELLARIRVHLRLRQSYKALVRQHLRQLQSLREAQAFLLPDSDTLPEAGFASSYIPLNHAGGDFYDVFQSARDTFDYVVADVSGHDLGASLPTAAIKALLRQNADMAYAPEESLRLLNTHLASVFAEGQYATLGHLRLNRKSGEASWTNAGHIPAIHLGSTGELIDIPGSPIGCFDSFEPGQSRFVLRKGERLLLISDGVVEQICGQTVSRSEGYAALLEACSRHRKTSLGSLPDTLLRDLHPDPSAATDDLLILAVEC